VSAGGIVTQRLASTGELIDELCEKAFNQVEIQYPIQKISEAFPICPLKSIVGVFTPSPTSHLWFKSENFPKNGDKALRNRKLNAKAAELALHHHNVHQKPSSFEIVLEFGKMGKNHLQWVCLLSGLQKPFPKILKLWLHLDAQTKEPIFLFT
jgi:hypothetical protein